MANEHSFDSQCYELAEYFFPDAPKALLDELAQRLQYQVESSPELDAWQVEEERRTRHRTEVVGYSPFEPPITREVTIEDPDEDHGE